MLGLYGHNNGLNYICTSYLQQGIMKPDIVFFGEDLPRKFYSYMKDMLQTDLVLVMGTSLEVIIPPANFVCGGYTVFTLSVRPCVRP